MILWESLAKSNCCQKSLLRLGQRGNCFKSYWYLSDFMSYINLCQLQINRYFSSLLLLIELNVKNSRITKVSINIF